MAKRKKFIIETFFHGTKTVWAEAERFARKAAQIRGWYVLSVREAPSESEGKKAA